MNETLPQFEQFKEMNNELVVPAYRQFCRDNGLNFHFWDELPEEDFKLKVANAEFKLQTEAMNLFNVLKPEYSFYNGSVVRYGFTCLDGDFDYSTQPLADFLNQAAQNQRRLEMVERRLEIICDVLALALGVILTFTLSRYVKWFSILPDWLPLVVFVTCGCLTWRWFFITRPKKQEARKRVSLHTKLAELRSRLASAHKALNVKPSALTEHGQLEDKLGTALAEHIMGRLGDEADDLEMQRYVLHDINSLMQTAGPGAEVEPRHLKSTGLLESHLIASMQIPAQVLMKELPKRTATWLASEPHWKSPERAQWVEEGRHLLDQARLNPSSSE